tara:strand:+ start:1066 stop:1224 length:159 start_codon:yes stop_codon:yes gene_type:complete
LTFDKEQSVYIEEEALGPTSVGSEMIMMSPYSSDILYKNIEDEPYIKQSDFM